MSNSQNLKLKENMRDARGYLNSARHEIEIGKASRRQILESLHLSLEWIIKAYGLAVGYVMPRIHSLQKLSQYVRGFDPEIADKLLKFVVLDEVSGPGRYHDLYEEERTGRESLQSIYGRVNVLFRFIEERINADRVLPEPDRDDVQLREAEDKLTYSGKYVSLDAFLPSFGFSMGGSCMIKLNHTTLTGVNITFQSHEIISSLFKGLQTQPDSCERGFIVGKIGEHSDRKYIIQLSSARLILNKRQTSELCKVMDLFAEKYLNRLQRVQSFLGLKRFELTSRGMGAARVIKIKEKLWWKILDYGQAHDFLNTDTQDSIYDSRANGLTVYPFPRGHKHHMNGSFWLTSESYEMNQSEVFVLWSFRYDSFKNYSDSESFFWDCEKVYAWFLNDLIPCVIHWGDQQDRNWYQLFQKKKNLESFKTSFELDRYIPERYSCDLIEENPESCSKKALQKKAREFQRFFSHSSYNDPQSAQVVGVLRSLEICLNSTFGGDDGFWRYIFRAFEDAKSGSVSESCIQYTEKYISSSRFINNVRVDMLFRSICHALESEFNNLSQDEVIEMWDNLKDINLFVEREKMMRKFGDFFRETAV